MICTSRFLSPGIQYHERIKDKNQAKKIEYDSKGCGEVKVTHCGLYGQRTNRESQNGNRCNGHVVTSFSQTEFIFKFGGIPAGNLSQKDSINKMLSTPTPRMIKSATSEMSDYGQYKAQIQVPRTRQLSRT